MLLAWKGCKQLHEGVNIFYHCSSAQFIFLSVYTISYIFNIKLAEKNKITFLQLTCNEGFQFRALKSIFLILTFVSFY